MHNTSILQGNKLRKESHSILYYSPHSLYSILVRVALGMGRRLNPETAPEIQLQLVDVQQGDNLTHEYLTLTPKGQVRDFHPCKRKVTDFDTTLGPGVEDM
jgi:hypothetical protein